jgi:hypothetical protein
VDKPDPDANARQQHEGREALDELVVPSGDATWVLSAIEEAFNAAAPRVNGLVDRIFRLARLGITAAPPRCSISWRTALLSYPLSPSICSGSQSMSSIKAR